MRLSKMDIMKWTFLRYWKRELKLRSRRGLKGIHELFGRNYAGEYLHVAYRREGEPEVVFHMRAMRPREKQRYRKNNPQK